MSEEVLSVVPPSLEEIEGAAKLLEAYVAQTPVSRWWGPGKDQHVGNDTEVFLKLEMLQYGGSFKPRGALINMLQLDQDQKKRGVTAVSAGNHAIAVSFAARMLGVPAKVVMPSSANPYRVDRCKDFGAEVVLVSDVAAAFEEVEKIKEEEGRIFIHPFEGKATAIGTATMGREFALQTPDLDALIIPIGGGGLAGGVSTAFRYLQPNCKLYGVEPTGADSMHRSFQSGKPERIEAVKTIADSLGAPFSLPYSYGLCKQNLDKIVLVEDHQLRTAMRVMFAEIKLAAEPAGAASLAALLGPLHDELQGKRVGLIACGSNIDVESFFQLLRL